VKMIYCHFPYCVTIVLHILLFLRWVYKTYSGRYRLDEEVSTWKYRQTLLHREIAEANADVVCLQEVSYISFESDFAFMRDLGYDKHEVYRKGRFRPATFWRTSRVTAFGPSLHRDRCLITAFTPACVDGTQPDGIIPTELIWVANVHLAAGDGVERNVRRFRQIFDCVDTIRKEQSKVISAKSKSRKEAASASKRSNSAAQSDVSSGAVLPVDLNLGVVIAGDTNVDSHCKDPSRPMATAVEVFLTTGSIGPEFLEEGYAVTSKVKVNKLGPLFDAYDFVYRSVGRSPPPTMVLEELYGVLTQPRAVDKEEHNEHSSNNAEDEEKESNHVLSALGLDLVDKVFDSFASIEVQTSGGDTERVMCHSDVVRWLTTINKQVGRGSEFRAVVKAMKMSTEEKQLIPDLDFSPPGDSIHAATESTLTEQSTATEVILPFEGYLNKSAFTDLYQAEIELGKVWGVAYDLSICGFGLPVSASLFKSRFDRFFVGGSVYRGDCTASGLPRQILLVVRDTDGDAMTEPVPNASFPSDHLSILCVVSWK